MGSKSIKFCAECNNLLYPRENKEVRVLMYACRRCKYEEEAESPCVYSHRVNNQMNELNMIITDVIEDPTLPRASVSCPQCGTQEPVYFQAQFNRAESGMRLYYVCANPQCGYKWVDSNVQTG